MDIIIYYISVGLICFLVGTFVSWVMIRGRTRKSFQLIKTELAQEQVRLSMLENDLSSTKEQRDKLQQTSTVFQVKVAELQNEVQAGLEVKNDLLSTREQRDRLQQTSTAFQIQIAKLQKEIQADSEKLAWLTNAEAQMREAFEALSGRMLQSNADSILKQSTIKLSDVVTPLRENLSLLDKQVRSLETKREGAYKGLEEQLRQLSTTQINLQNTASTLTEALRSPTVRGKWGELQLQRVVEMAGMVKNIQFQEQATTDRGRPDMITYLPNGGILPLDSKVPLEAYLNSVEAKTEPERKLELVKHANAMKSRVMELSRKEYWTQFESSPDFVVMFVPNEACLGAAFEADPRLLDYALDKKVLIATPVTLLALLKAVAFGWQQHEITENSQKIAEEGKELYRRMNKVFEHLGELQKNLTRTVASFNKTVGSVETRLIPTARRLEEMGVSSTSISTPKQIETQVRLPSHE